MDKDCITLVNLNIEKRRHLDKIIPWLQKVAPDVICLQELAGLDLQIFRKGMGMEGIFIPMTYDVESDSRRTEWGLGLLTRLPHGDFRTIYYYGVPDRLSEYRKENQNTANKLLLFTTVRKEDSLFTVGTTHFTWTPNGQADDFQRKDIEALFGILASIPEIVFCGDFNAPRGREIFNMIAKRYKDNIPPEHTSSIDGNLHRNGHLNLMVDGIFSTPQYILKNTMVISGISDHCAITTRIYRDEF